MDARSELRSFLASRRAKLTPEQAGLAVDGGRRRVPGLRREEVARLAGVSVEYYSKLERGTFGVVSENILTAIAEALQLDPAEEEHLFALSLADARQRRREHAPSIDSVRPAVRRLVQSITGVVAFVRNNRRDILAINRIGLALYWELFEDAEPGTPVNTARFLFTHHRAYEVNPDRARSAAEIAASLRTELGRAPHDEALQALIEELEIRSADFREMWAARDVRYNDSGYRSMRHGIVGELTLSYEALDLRADPGLTLIAYSAEPGTPSADRYAALARWAASDEFEALIADHPARPWTTFG